MSPQDTVCSAGRSDTPLTVEAARLRALAAAAPVCDAESLSLEGAIGRILDHAVPARKAGRPLGRISAELASTLQRAQQRWTLG